MFDVSSNFLKQSKLLKYKKINFYIQNNQKEKLKCHSYDTGRLVCGGKMIRSHTCNKNEQNSN